MRFVTHSVDETEALGERLAKTLHGGEIIAFTGDLGAGKTAFTRGLARGLGIPMRVTSRPIPSSTNIRAPPAVVPF